MSALREVIRILGSQAELARRVGVSLQAVHQWVKADSVPAHRVILVETICEGVVTRYQLRPDIFGSVEHLPISGLSTRKKTVSGTK